MYTHRQILSINIYDFVGRDSEIVKYENGGTQWCITHKSLLEKYIADMVCSRINNVHHMQKFVREGRDRNACFALLRQGGLPEYNPDSTLAPRTSSAP